MTKMIFIARKRSDLTFDAFITYWERVHAPLVARIPGVRRYVIRPVISAESAEAEPVCDGLGETRFDSSAMAQEAAGSTEGRAANADVPLFCAPNSGVVMVDDIAIVGVLAPDEAAGDQIRGAWIGAYETTRDPA